MIYTNDTWFGGFKIVIHMNVTSLLAILLRIIKSKVIWIPSVLTVNFRS